MNSKRCFEILEIPPDATYEEAKGAYRQMCQVWHPDKYTHSEQLHAKATCKIKEINAAWSQIEEYFKTGAPGETETKEAENRSREEQERSQRTEQENKRRETGNEEQYNHQQNKEQQTSQSINNPRKPWIAGILSIIQPGLGQVYNGEISKALLIYFIPILLIPGLMFCVHSEFTLIVIVAYAILGAAYYVLVFANAVREARRFRNQYIPKKYNTVIAYISIYVLVSVLSISISTAVKFNIIQAYKIPAGSMEPTLLIGDHILVDRSKSAKNPSLGDLIVFEYPEDPSKDFIKRVVAVGSDTVENRNKELFVNGKAVTENYAVHKESNMIPANLNPRDNFGPKMIPDSSYFVMGDNRDRSYDSRFWGAVPKDKVKGTVKIIYWSWDREKNSVRWDRIGMKVL